MPRAQHPHAIAGKEQRTKQAKTMSYKAMYKNELARAAGVSTAVFRTWMKSDKQALEAMGITPRQQLLPPVAVRYLCEKYVIDVSQ